MSNQPALKTSERDTTVTPHQLRTAGYIPATVYGSGIQSQSIQVREHEFYQAFLQGKREFNLDGFITGQAKTQNVLRHPVTQKPISIEFHLESEKGGKKKGK